MMQYPALWSDNGEFIVQVGMEPVSVMGVKEKNGLSYVFSLFRANAEADYYAIDADSGEIVGAAIVSDESTGYADVGLKISERRDKPCDLSLLF